MSNKNATKCRGDSMLESIVSDHKVHLADIFTSKTEGCVHHKKVTAVAFSTEGWFPLNRDTICLYDETLRSLKDMCANVLANSEQKDICIAKVPSVWFVKKQNVQVVFFNNGDGSQ